MAFRLVLQPVVASLLAWRAGWRDARNGRSPFLYTLLSDRSQRRYLLGEGWKEISKVFALAVLLDLIYQGLVLGSLRPGRSLVVAGVLALVPYGLLRGLACRFARSRRPPAAYIGDPARD